MNSAISPRRTPTATRPLARLPISSSARSFTAVASTLIATASSNMLIPVVMPIWSNLANFINSASAPRITMTLAIPLASSSQLSPDRSLTALASTLTAAARIRIPIAPLIDIPESLSMSFRAPTSAAIRTITPERPLASSSQSSSAKDLTAPARISMAIDSRIRPAAISVNLSAALTPKILLKPARDPMSSPNRTVIAPIVAAS